MVPPLPARRWLVLWVCLLAATAQAAPEPAPQPEEPDVDFLDFLGSWQNDDGRWVDPFNIADELPARAGTESKTDRPGPAAGPRNPSKNSQSNRAQDTPRDPMRTQTDP